MTEPDEQHLMTVFTAAVDHSTAGEREAYLNRACAGAPRLRQRVEALLRAHNRPGKFLQECDRPATATFVPQSGSDARSSVGRALEEELRRLLRSRLLAVHLLAMSYLLLMAALFVFMPADTNASGEGRDADENLAMLALPLAQSVIGAIVLWRSLGMSLPGLRHWEVVHFAIQALYHGLVRYEMLAYVDRAAADPAPALVGFAGAVTVIGFIALVLAYGVLVPNTRRRALVGVGALATVPFVTVLAAALAHPALWGRHVVPLLLQAAAFMTFPAAVAVFAAARATALQRRAIEAERRAEQVGQYTLQRKLGEGGMGEVWLAEHQLLKRPCAVKFVRPDLAASPATAARFAREVEAVTRLSHVNTIRVYDYGRTDDGAFYLVMEYLNGPTLEDLIRTSGPIAPARAVHLLRQVCGALAEAHAAGLVHRDLKPGNVIVADLGGQPDVAKLLDFGLVHDLSTMADDRLTRTGTVLGTPAYMSPEQAAGESTADARGDVYSLGAVAFFTLTGRPPFQGKTLGRVLAAHRSEPPPNLTELRPDLPADLAAVIARCLAKDPADRFPTAVELERALAHCSCAGDWPAERSPSDAPHSHAPS